MSKTLSLVTTLLFASLLFGCQPSALMPTWAGQSSIAYQNDVLGVQVKDTAVPSTTTSTTNWRPHRLTDIGLELLLPPDWKTLRIEGGYVARPASVQSEIDPAAFALVLSYRQDDLPQALPALTEILAPRLGENEPHPLTNQPITVGGHAGVVFLDFQNLCMEIFVPAGGIIHQVNIGSYFCAGEPGKRYLTPEGQAVLASIRFLPLQKNLAPTPTSAAPITGTLAPTLPETLATHVLLRLAGQSPATLALDNQAVYWVAHRDSHALYRYPLAVNTQTPATITIVATSHYSDGVLMELPLVAMDNWLIFYDGAYDAISSVWQLRALNLIDGTEQRLVESKGNAILYDFAAANNRVVWSWTEHVEHRACPDQAVLSMLDLANGQRQELNRACFQTEHSWRALSLDGNRLAAEYWQYNVEPGKTWGDIVLFDLSASDPTRFSVLKASPAARQNAYPSLSGNWVAWQRGTRTQDNCVLFDLRTQTQHPLPPTWGQPNCQIFHATSGWLLSLDVASTQAVQLYQPDRQQAIRVQAQTKGWIEAATVSNQTVALAVRLAPEQTKQLNSVIEWARLAERP